MRRYQTIICLGIIGVGMILAIITAATRKDEVTQASSSNITQAAVVVSEPAAHVVEAPNPEDSVYSFLQGPKSWKEKRPWSGKWGNTYMDGSNFGGFGCGFCCMANIYSTLSPFECSPVDVYKYSIQSTDYGGGGAIDWHFMKATLEEIGFDSILANKPDTYEQFQAEVKASAAMITLVSSYDDASYWENTPGHYVTIFLYDEGTDTVFLTDSGNPDHNRSRVKLKKIYKALKQSSKYQYLSLFPYDENKNQWQHNGVNYRWVSPWQ